MSALVEEVRVEAVSSLLLGRAPDLLDNTDPRHDLYVEAIAGIATEVVDIVGEDPQPPVRGLAIWAITLGTAAHLESALFPEQQLGGQDNSGEVLHRRYLGVLAALRRSAGVSGGPLGRFPDPLPYPDPAAPLRRC